MVRLLAALILLSACGPNRPTAATSTGAPGTISLAATRPSVGTAAPRSPDAGRWAGVTCGDTVCSGVTPYCCRQGGDHCAAKAPDPYSCLACDGPEDCQAGKHCVNAALGPLGCFATVCCGTDDCYDACRSDRDCEPCRPQCRNATPDRAGSCH